MTDGQRPAASVVERPELVDILRLLGKVMTKVGLHRTRAGGDLGLTSLQLTALGAIGRGGGLTMGQLAREMMMVQSASSRLVDDLVRKGLVKRNRNRQDRRVVRVALTSRGRQVIVQARAESQMLMARVLDKMSPQEATTLVRGLEYLLRAVDDTERDYFSNCSQPECRDLVKQDGDDAAS